jgi:hypothetical protein
MKTFKFLEKTLEKTIVFTYQTLGTYPNDIVDTWDRLEYDAGAAAAVRMWENNTGHVLCPFDYLSHSWECWTRGYNNTYRTLIRDRRNENI